MADSDKAVFLSYASQDADDPSQAHYTAISVFMACGLKHEAEALLPQVSPVGDDRILALIYLERMQEALALLDTATPGIIPYAFYGSGLGEFDSVRTDPVFERWLAETGLVEDHARAQAWRQAHPPERPELKS